MKPLIIRNSKEVIISFGGVKLVKPLSEYIDMTDNEIIEKFMTERGEKN